MAGPTKAQLEAMLEAERAKRQQDAERATALEAQLRLELQQQQETITQQAATLQTVGRNGQGVAGVAAGAGAGGDGVPDNSVLKPEGKWDVKSVLGISNEDVSIIRDEIRTLVHSCGLNWQVSWPQQDADRLGSLYRQARKAHPILKRYAGNWMTKHMVQTYLINKRRLAYAKNHLEPPKQYRGRLGRPKQRAPPTNEETNSDMSGNEENNDPDQVE